MYKVLSELKHNGVLYMIGDIVYEIDKEAAEILVDSKVIAKIETAVIPEVPKHYVISAETDKPLDEINPATAEPGDLSMEQITALIPSAEILVDSSQIVAPSSDDITQTAEQFS